MHMALRFCLGGLEYLQMPGHAQLNPKRASGQPRRPSDDGELLSPAHHIRNDRTLQKVGRGNLRGADTPRLATGRALSRESPRRITGRNQHVPAQKHRLDNRPPHKMGHQAATDGLNLGKFGHAKQ